MIGTVPVGGGIEVGAVGEDEPQAAANPANATMMAIRTQKANHEGHEGEARKKRSLFRILRVPRGCIQGTSAGLRCRTPRQSSSNESHERNTVNPATSVVQTFFDQYARSRSALDIDLIASQYPDSFMYAGPNGARVAEKTAVLAAFPRGQELLQAHGHRSTKVLSLDETMLDAQYALVRVQFVWRFEKSPAQPIDVTVDATFILHLNRGAPQIVFQLEHQDFQAALRTSGVLPAAP
jgi:hypothetical protein